MPIYVRTLSINANRWLALRLELIGSAIILSTAGFAIISVLTGSGSSARLVGPSMSHALLVPSILLLFSFFQFPLFLSIPRVVHTNPGRRQITQSLNWIVRHTGETETNIVSVERILEYIRLPSEAPDAIHHNRPPASWPAQGAVKYCKYSTRYRPGLDLVLKDINLNLKPRERIGVVGRTGAGKSSLAMSPFRIIEPSGGNISIDNLNTSTIGLLDLRQRLAIIPQNTAAFERTIRDNLDPYLVHDDTKLWAVLGAF